MAAKHPLDTEQFPNKRVKTDETNGNLDAVERTDGDQERAVGITAYVSPDTPGFQCVVKQRYTDFLVNEILPDGQVLHLTELPGTRRRKHDEIQASLPDVSEESPALDVVADIKADEPAPIEVSKVHETNKHSETSTDDQSGHVVVPELSSEDQTTLRDIFGDQPTSDIAKLYSSVIRHPYKKPRDLPTVKSPVISEKSKRTQAHVAIRQIFNSKLQTETLQDEPGVIAIKAAPSKQKNTRGREQQSNGDGAIPKGKLGWDELGGEYLHFTLYKENKDTMEVLFFIASQLKVAVKNFQFAGTKDRRGVTVQRVAVLRVHANRIANLNRQARGWVVSGFEYKKHGLELGELLGNEFTLTLRDCHVNGENGLNDSQRLHLVRDVVWNAAESFRTNGFLNYYGLQRFGSYSTGTHMTGMKILQGDLEGAVNSILAYSPELLQENQHANGTAKVPQDDINRADTIRKWRETGVLGHMPRRYQAEYSIMQYLSKKEKKTGRLIQANDWQGALMTIQRNLRMMYVHAYQSLVWNTVAGRRLGVYGYEVVEGDLVIIGEKGGDDAFEVQEEVDEDGEPIFRPAEHDQAASAEDKFTRARHLTKEEARSGKFDIFDIVLPQPGYDVLYPANDIGKFYEEFMGSEAGGKLDPHNMRRAWKDASLSGGYRKVMARPLQGVKVDVKEYGRVEEQLVETDLEKLHKAAGLQHETGAENAANGEATVDIEADGKEENGKKVAVVMKFQLGSSQYATMALRELTKGAAVAYKPDYSTAR